MTPEQVNRTVATSCLVASHFHYLLAAYAAFVYPIKRHQGTALIVKAAVLAGSFAVTISLLLVKYRTTNLKLSRAALFLSLASFVLGLAFGLIAYEENVGDEREFTLLTAIIGYLPLGIDTLPSGSKGS